MAIATRETTRSQVMVKIEYFSLHDKCGDKYETTEFTAGNYKWRLIIYPNGHGTEKPGEYVSVYVAISGTGLLPEDWEVNAVFSIFILNQISGSHEYHHTTGSARRYFRLKTEWGVPYFIPKNDLMNPSNGFLINDCCLFGAEVFVIDNVKVFTRCLSLMDVEVPYKHTIKISNLSKLKEKNWYSEEFTAGGYRWSIELFPNGYEEEAERSLSIYLAYLPSNNNYSDERLKVCYTICMKNQLDPNMNRKDTSSNWFDASVASWGWPSFVLLDELKSTCGGFIVNDTCLFELEVSVLAVAK